jgi:hypothetical protein
MAGAQARCTSDEGSAWAIRDLLSFLGYSVIAATVVCLGGGYWLRYRSRKIACADVEICARPLPNRIVTIGLVLATVLVAGALALDFLAPLFL